MAKHDKIWSQVEQLLKSDLSPTMYNTWILPLEPTVMTKDRFVLYAPNLYIKRLVNERFIDDIQKYMDYITNSHLIVEIVDSKDDLPQVEIKEDPKGQQYFAEKETPEEEVYSPDPILNPKYTFDTFVKGKSNELALAGAKAVSRNPYTAYNPLFIWGGPGLGKTHLMQAIAHEIRERDPKKKVVYISSETFTNELISAIGDKSTKKNKEFRKKYRNIDVLLIDDIQFIAGKQGTQEEFFHTFNELYEQNKQIILSSDRPPKEIKTLENRLVSRFEWGLMADIQMPDYETRVAILQAKLEQEKEDLPREVLEYIAMNVKSNIRELEGALLTVIAYMSLTEQKVMDMEMARIALKKIIQESSKLPIDIPLIIEKTADYYHVKVEDLESKNRSKRIAYPRQIAMYLARQMTDSSLVRIAEAFDRDHSTVIHGVNKIEDDLKKDHELKNQIDDLILTIEEA